MIESRLRTTSAAHWRESRTVSAAARGAPDSVWSAGEVIAGGRFKVGRVLGAGGMGTVYEAFDTKLNCAVAIKTVASEPSCIYDLKNEFRAITELRHENLVCVHDLFCERGRWFFSMELIAGCPFNEWVRPRGILDEPRLRSAMLQLVRALRHIHATGKLHRDLKPNNVLVTTAGRLVVLDFGLVAETMPGGAGQTLSEGHVIGTPSYMSPEQAAGRPAEAASDFYAVGTMLFEALTGKVPFEGSCVTVLCTKQRESAPQPAMTDARAMSDLVELAKRLLALNPSDRPSGEMLSRAFANPTVLERSMTRRRPTPKPSHTTGTRKLHELYDATVRGEQVVAVVSSDDTASAALCRTFVEELSAAKEAVILSGRCSEREQVPYRAVDPIVDDLSRYLRRLPAHRAAMLLPRDVGALVQLFPALARVAVVEEFPRCRDAHARPLHERVEGALLEFLSRLRDWQPVVLWLDNLQAMDDNSVRLVSSLLAQPHPIPIFALLSQRHVHSHPSPCVRTLLEAVRGSSARTVMFSSQ